MPCENSARKRSKTMAFRCTPEEYELIANMAAWSGMSRQDYIMARLTGTEVTVRPSSRTQRALRDSMKELAERLLAVGNQGNLMKKVYTIFIKKEERYDRSRGHR